MKRATTPRILKVYFIRKPRMSQATQETQALGQSIYLSFPVAKCQSLIFGNMTSFILAPLLLDVDGDRFMHQLWQQRGGSAGPGAGGPNSVSINNSPGGASSPLSSGSGLSANHRAADGRAKSQPHIAYPYNLDFTGSAANPAPVEAAADARVIPATGKQFPRIHATL